MNRTTLIEILAHYGVHPSKAKGQNFLVDQNMLAAMVRSMKLVPGEQILEVGPGTGILTRMILEAGCDLISVEMDTKLHKYLTENIVANNFRLVLGDACKVNYNEILNFSIPYRCIANLPYAISSVFIAKLTQLPVKPTEMYFLLQKEMAERFTAKLGTKKYGSLSVRAGAIYESNILRKVPPQVFFPPPTIDSSFIHLKMKSSIPPESVLKTLNKLVKIAFSQRRKKALKLLTTNIQKVNFEEIFHSAQIGLNDRAEDISIAQYIKMSELVNLHNDVSIPTLADED